MPPDSSARSHGGGGGVEPREAASVSHPALCYNSSSAVTGFTVPFFYSFGNGRRVNLTARHFSPARQRTVKRHRFILKLLHTQNQSGNHFRGDPGRSRDSGGSSSPIVSFRGIFPSADVREKDSKQFSAEMFKRELISSISQVMPGTSCTARNK